MLTQKNNSNDAILQRTFSVAPMLSWTDKHCRYFHRLLSSHALLYTEMVSTDSLLYGTNPRLLNRYQIVNPVAFQLGGSDPYALAKCAKMIETAGYDEINLNVGCPSDRVQKGRFGACLMAEPALVADCVDAMRQVASVPVTVKSRIGIDDIDSYQELLHFVSTVADAGCNIFIIHARKAWLKGLSPKQNREIPPLQYNIVYRLKKECPTLKIILNGGVSSIVSAQYILQFVDGVMVGREAYHNPYFLSAVDTHLYADSVAIKTRHQVVLELVPYIKEHIASGGNLQNITRHILGLFNGVVGAKKWRRLLSENATKKDADETVVLDALNNIPL